ncbi:MAG: HEAT repeat domain-containing protein [Symploca sp. SIO2E6]|nr:HEAT repeat domain-containing protein [Symploca sp. SIO2E6]
MLYTLEQAHVAAQQANWSLLNQHLQQLPLKKNGNGSQVLGETDCQQVLHLALQVIEAGDFQEKWDVAKVFPKLGKCSIAPLIAIVEDEAADLEVRWFASRILGEFDDPLVVISLVELLQSAEDEDLAEMAAQALSNIGSSAITALSSLLLEEESKYLAVQALAHIRHPETIAPLLTVVNDPLPSIRSTAIEALISFRDRRILPVLLEALQDPAAVVRKQAVIGLGLRGSNLPELEVLDYLKPLLYDFNPQVCQQAAIALGRLGTDEAAEALFRVLKSPATPISLQIDFVRALGWVQTPLALEYLQQALISFPVDYLHLGGNKAEGRRQKAEGKDKCLAGYDMTRVTPEVSQEIIAVLGRIELAELKSQATQILIELLHSEQFSVPYPTLKQTLAMSLGQLGEAQALEPLIKLLEEPDLTVRLHAIAALKNIPHAYSTLQQYGADENLTSKLQQGIAIALAEWF